MLRTLQTAFLLLALTAMAQQQKPVEIAAEPGHQLVLENAFVRAFKVTVPPKASTLVHRHNFDYIFVTLGDADITNERVGAQPARLILKDGEVRFTAGLFAHSIINNIDRPFHNITIELLTPTTGEHRCTGFCSIPAACEAKNEACPTMEWLVTSDQWTVTAVTLPPSARYEEHTHTGPHLVMAVSDLDIKIKGQDRPETEVKAKAGDLSWQNPGTHTLINVGTKPARFVILEFQGGRPQPPVQLSTNEFACFQFAAA